MTYVLDSNKPSNVICNIRMLIFHYILVNLNSPCPLHEQAKDETIFLGSAQCNYICA